jgi:2-oxoisovalerate dehydrogenase E2 component (dihydrolipoyl transacylase)
MKIELPQVGESVTEGIIDRWLKKEGDRVEKYEPLAEVITDKVNMEMPSPVSGVLTKIFAKEGDTVPMGSVIAEIAVEGEENVEAGLKPVPTPPQEKEPQPVSTLGEFIKDSAPVGPTGSGGTATAQAEHRRPETTQPRRRYSPAVLRLAEEHKVDLTTITGTGINGRITRKDVQAFIDSGNAEVISESSAVETAPPPQPVSAGQDEERIPLTTVRRMIAANMVRSATQIPQAWTIQEVEVTGLVNRRESIKTDFQNREGINITYLPFVVKAVAESLKENPLMNSSWDDAAIILKKRVNIGIAVAAKNGLVVPVIHDADTLSIAGLARKIDDLTGRARQGRLSVQDVQGGTFTVNNTGALGSIASQPLVNPPQAGIMTTEAIVKRPVVINDAIAIRSMMNICLTFDHRIIDGAEASSFVNAVKKRLETIGPDTGIY